MSGAEDPLLLDYRVAFLRYLPQRGEAALTAGYGLGRRAVEGGTSVLDLVRVHHEVVGEVVAEPGVDAPATVAAAAEFLTEVLATVEMAQRALRPDADGRSS